MAALPREERKRRLGAQLRVRRAPTLPALLEVVDQLGAELEAGGGGDVKLVVVDSIYAALIAEHTNLTRSAAGAQVARLQQALRRLASHHRLAIVLVNAAAPMGALDLAGGMAGSAGLQLQSAVCGHVQAWRATLGQHWLHTADVRLALRPDPNGPPDASSRAHLLSIIKCLSCEREIAAADDCILLDVTGTGVAGSAVGRAPPS